MWDLNSDIWHFCLTILIFFCRLFTLLDVWLWNIYISFYCWGYITVTISIRSRSIQCLVQLHHLWQLSLSELLALVQKIQLLLKARSVMIHQLFWGLWVENLFSIIQLFSILGIFSYFLGLLLCLIQELQYDQKSGFHFLDSFPNNVDVGTYDFVFEVFLSV